MAASGRPVPHLTVAVARAGGTGVLDLGTDRGPALAALADVHRWWTGPFGVRVPPGCGVRPAEIPPTARTVVVDAPALASDDWLDIAGIVRGRRLLIEVSDPGDAAPAIRVGRGLTDEVGLIARGRGDLTTYVLLQRLLGDIDVPVYAAGGIGPHSAAAAVAGGAAGIVLDEQLACVREMDLLDAPAMALARRYKTAGGVVQAVREQIVAHLRAALRAEPLAPRPDPVVVQGPMTQVSDRSAFAGAVAQEGGLPFLALGSMDGGQARALLGETADRLGDRPWGAAILSGPPDLREEQLAAVSAARPPYAIIGAGRPAEAASLEDAGISAYLHVPSPELLGRLLDEGARKFVFAGREGGGPAGPRASLPLWDAQVERLMAFGDAAGLSVMFAGGVHDERSAAMVAALAGPLADRGADVRVLMGTAYLFTPEAVAAGAIVPGFQDVALACEGTALLETAPGQAIRCARTPYVGTFEETRRELEQDGTPEHEVRRRLDKLNLGRLHLASRGLRLDTPVDPVRQRSEGMYAMGQVAALRSTRTGIAALHAQVTSGATAFLAARAAELGITPHQPAEPARPADIAIIGLACVFPNAPDTDTYWANTVRSETNTPPKRAGLVPDIPFDTEAHGVDSLSGPETPPRPGSLVRDIPLDMPACGVDSVSEPGTPPKTGGLVPDVPFDAAAYGISDEAIGGIDAMQLLSLEVAGRALRDAGYGDRPFERSRASVFFAAEGGGDLGAAYGLRATLPGYFGELPAGLDEQLPRPDGESLDGVLAGGVAARIAEGLGLGGGACTVGATVLAALDAACKELVTGSSAMVLCGGAELRGIVHDPADGEGVACLVLKRLADAERDGDRIYAVVKSVAGAGGGLALERAHERAGVSPSSVELVESGHIRGVAGLIKTAYALHTGVLPGMSEARPWVVRPGERFGGVGESGFGGTRFHAVLSGYGGAPEPVSGLAEWPAELFLIRGDDWAGARAEIDRLSRLIGEGRLRDLARTAASGAGPVQVAFVASGVDDLRDKLALAAEFRPVPGVHIGACEAGQVAFLFPDEAVRPGTVADLFVAFPRLQRLLRLAGGRYAGIAGLAVHRLLTAVGVHPDLAAGHGHGELAALCAAGVIDDTDMIEISAGGVVPSRADLLGRDLRSPAFPVWADTTDRPYETEPADLAAGPAVPVPLAEQIEAMYEAGARTFVEVGPGRALTDLAGTILGDRPHTAVSCADPGENGLVALLRALAELSAAGVPVDPLPLFAGRDAHMVTGVRVTPGWLVSGHSVRTAGGEYPVGALRPPKRVASVRPADPAVLEYLRTSREVIAAQREVVLRHLAAPVPDPPAASPRPSVPPQNRPSAHVRSAALSGGPVPAVQEVATAVVEEEPAQVVPRMRRPDRQVWPRPEVRVARRVVRRIPRMMDLDPLPMPPESGTAFAGRRFVVVDDGCGIALELGDLLERHGAEVRTPQDVDGPCDGLVHLAALRPAAKSVLPSAFAGIGRALSGELRWLVLAGGTFGHGFRGGIGDPAPEAGLRGLARMLAHEYPEALVRALDLDTKDTPRAIARRIMAELLTAEAPVVVAHEGGRRRGLQLLPSEPPQGEGVPKLGPDGVVLLTGGEHEVIVRAALELARTSGCHIELMGRTQDIPDALEEHAASVRYHAGDARDAQAVRNVAENVQMAHRRLDGVIHTAGGEMPESLGDAYRAKVDSASALAQTVMPDVGFFAVLCGLAGVHDQGQAGDAAADDACGTLAHVWRRRLRGRVLVAGLGPDGLVDPDAAAAALLREIACGDEAHVVLTGEVR
ncbi:nitronate monooxygenase [Actinomadura sp. BRA 177]|nr:nitronate monooxygenase [Actinomadura sp. BRA 177]